MSLRATRRLAFAPPVCCCRLIVNRVKVNDVAPKVTVTGPPAASTEAPKRAFGEPNGVGAAADRAAGSAAPYRSAIAALYGEVTRRMLVIAWGKMFST